MIILCVCVSCGFGEDEWKGDFSAMAVAAHFGKKENNIRSWLEMSKEDMAPVKEEIPELVEFAPVLEYEGTEFTARVLFDGNGGMKQFFYLFSPEDKEKSWDVLETLYQEFSTQDEAERASGTLRERTKMPAFTKDREYFVQWVLRDGDQAGQYKMTFFYQKATDVSMIFIEEIESAPGQADYS